MSLFAIERYDSNEASSPSSQAEDILNKLKENALKQKIIKDKKTSNDVITKNKGKKKRKLNKEEPQEEEETKSNPVKKSRKSELPVVSLESVVNDKQVDRECQKQDSEGVHGGVQEGVQGTDETASAVVAEETGYDLQQDELQQDEVKSDGEMFPVLGEYKHDRQTAHIHRVLPEWLTNPTIIENDLSAGATPITEMTCLNDNIKTRLQDNGITSLFPVQAVVVPALLSSHVACAGYAPADLCVSAPTGSGKTLAFILPIVQTLESRIVCRVRALVVLPTRDLAAQVYNVFCSYAQNTKLKVALVTGHKPLAREQTMLVRQGIRQFQSLADIVVATPGRLVDHIKHTRGFTLRYLRYLVIDEADRMMDEVKQDWLLHLEASIEGCTARDLAHNTRLADVDLSGISQQSLTVSTAHYSDTLPLQKLLFSATLSQNPEKLQQLRLMQPRLFTAVVPGCQSGADGGFIGKFTTPAGLTEYLIQSNEGQKPLLVLHLLMTMRFRQMLVFTNSLEATHRLFLLVKEVGNMEVKEFTASLKPSRRTKILKKFAAGKVNLIICSDAMARGMDVENVKCVVSYDCPKFTRTYIHRIGRTARAGKVGTAITLLEKKEIFHFKKMIKESGKPKVKELKVSQGELRPLEETYTMALLGLKTALGQEQVKKKQMPKDKKNKQIQIKR